MSKYSSNNIRLGIFTVLGIFLFTAAVYVVGARQGKFGDMYHLDALFDNANGLQVGHNVRYSGIKVGSVEGIIFVNDSTLRVKMLLNTDLKRLIRKNATASIGLDGLVGDVVINIKPGEGNEPLAKNGDTLPTVRRRDSADMMETLGGTNENIATISLKLLEISTKLNEGNGTLPMLLRDSLLAAEFVSTLRNLRLASENMNAMTAELRSDVKGVSQGKGTLGYLLHDQTLPHQAESLIARLDSGVVAQTAPILQNLQRSSEDIAASSATLKSALESVNTSGGPANALLHDTAATADLLQSLDNLKEGTARFCENMEALKHNFLFRKYFKKLEKEKKKKG
jgi:phospholipid/cholesterol/gamma-HCH transport system substrate-binding protein